MEKKKLIETIERTQSAVGMLALRDDILDALKGGGEKKKKKPDEGVEE